MAEKVADPFAAEAAARAQLAAMVPRLSDAPHALLGVPATVAPDVLRAAFLTLAKRFHPTKFARFSPDVVKLANEVFLTIKRAYDQLAPAAAAFAQGTGVRSVVRAAGTSPPPSPTSAPPPAQNARFVSPARAVTNVGPAPAPPAHRATTPPRQPDPPRRPSGQIAVPVMPAATPSAAAAKPGPTPAPTPTPTPLDEAMELLRRKLWNDARQAFHKLAVAAPHDRNLRAHMHYARGKEAIEAGRLDEARAELQRALALDPELTRARSALDDIPKDPTQGAWGRLFKK